MARVELPGSLRCCGAPDSSENGLKSSVAISASNTSSFGVLTGVRIDICKDTNHQDKLSSCKASKRYRTICLVVHKCDARVHRASCSEDTKIQLQTSACMQLCLNERECECVYWCEGACTTIIGQISLGETRDEYDLRRTRAAATSDEVLACA